MYYRLKSQYVLRGWSKAAWTLVKRPENKIRHLNQEEFQALLLCDGLTDSDSEYISCKMKQRLERYQEEGIVESCLYKKELEMDQHYRYYDNRFVRSVFWSVTGRCNYRCRHCYMDAPEGRMGELSHEQAMDLIDQMAECGVMSVDITGGEPLIREDFWSLIDQIQYRNMTIGQVYTNGRLLTDSVLDKFERRNLKPEFSISFDGVGWHDWMRGVQGAEKAALRALELCERRGFPTSVELCVHKGSLSALPDTVELLAGMGVSRLRIGTIAETDLWKKNSQGNTMSFRAYIEEMIRYIPRFFRAEMPMDIILAGVIRLHKKSKAFSVIPMRYYGTSECENRLLCKAARYACYITPEGRLLPCMPMTALKEQELFPLIQDIGLKKGLSDSFYMKIVDNRVGDLLKVNQKCAECEHKYHCGGGCRASALEQTGDLMGSVEEQCILWKEGYVERIQKAAETAIMEYCAEDAND